MASVSPMASAAAHGHCAAIDTGFVALGDWNGNGTDKIGVFRPSTREWLLDLNGNGVFDGCNVDICATFGQAGDLPIVGKW